ncbi:hypothetical protein ACFXKJ_38535 [Kitasatospora indigofera]|uniref:hypothetical protein n=1 Tax=Kitasatospora indigofera TaxID=67307 RepID=UPI003646A4CC
MAPRSADCCSVWAIGATTLDHLWRKGLRSPQRWDVLALPLTGHHLERDPTEWPSGNAALLDG